MIFKDQFGYPVDETGDAGDSANRAGLLALCGQDQRLEGYFVTPWTLPTRHPTQVPWNSPRNFSRDQLIALTAGLKAKGLFALANTVYTERLMSLPFAANWERDFVGSTKYPWPHKVEGKWRFFDCADILSPADYWHLSNCGQSPSRFLWAIVGVPWLIAELFVHCKLSSPLAEDNQMIAKVLSAGRWATRLFKRWKPAYAYSLHDYWASRKEEEYFMLLNFKVEKVAK